MINVYKNLKSKIKNQKFSSGLRSRELSDRVWWFINMRWCAIGLCLFGLLTITLGIVPANLNAFYFLFAMIFLIITNLFYSFFAHRFTTASSDRRSTNRGGTRVLLITQVITDYMALSLITYACGTIETPVHILFIAHIILITLFFPRAFSLLITSVGLIFASLPMILEWGGIVPVVTIFQSSFKQTVSASLPITSGIIIGLAGCYFVCWYLVSEISSSLRLREYELEQAYDMLLKIDKEKTESTLRATHELKAPFAAIKNYVYTLRDGYCGPLPEKARQVVIRIGDRCDRLMVNITNIIRLNNLKTLVLTEKNFTEVNLNDFVENEVHDAGIAGKSRGITIKIPNYFKHDPPVLIRGSKEHLHIMISNLLQNAITYSHDQGTVEVSMDKKNGKISLHITDHGIGIPHKNINKIFDEHFRCNNAVRHNPNGNGLGLAIVRETVTLHNASMDIYSTEGKETRFTVTFDLVKQGINKL